MVHGGGAFERPLSHEGGALMNGLVPYRERLQRAHLYLCVKIQQEVYNLKELPPQTLSMLAL